MTITVSVPDQLAERAANQGISVEAYVERLAHQAAQSELRQKPRRTPAEAVAYLREARKGVTSAVSGSKILSSRAANIKQRFRARCVDYPSMVFS